MSNVLDYELDFQFDKIKDRDVSHLNFYRYEDCVYAVWKDNGDNGVYMSVSIDSGVTFCQAQKVMDTTGDIRDLQVLAKDSQFVIALVEKKSNLESKRAVSGWLRKEKKTLSYKPCTSHQVNGRLINMFLSFKQGQSIDHMMIKTDDGIIHEIAMGHTCAVKDVKSKEITTINL